MSNRFNDELVDRAIDIVEAYLAKKKDKIHPAVREFMYQQEYTKLLERCE